MNIDNLMREHKGIFEEINYINVKLAEKNLEADLLDITSHINKLAGKLKIHLGSEDKFLYPNLLNGTNETLKNLANSYIDEMGGIADIFTDYKNQFNTKSKIIAAGIESFLTETRKILKSIEIRINKEENELYKMINKL
ncbi:hemerythrin domain-containing protein [Clostridium sp.]|uniref:hemerythrin domain-containing protein n=1 Tax=Clostridium sp. TaxID=1506 RepID=UPI002840139D|nr:hemerythrin domain-containing protein [Clostridium sp.]MDR3593922.1 hemerythrin domain-containing protein [Clostridium sp.]